MATEDVVARQPKLESSVLNCFAGRHTWLYGYGTEYTQFAEWSKVCKVCDEFYLLTVAGKYERCNKPV